ncbi:MAG: type II secretion system protein [Patescibacteria group bacterium]|nr:type II secretion system protein [Patescibacteria group bacterium]
MRKTNKGFTLIELLVVIAIIGLLSTLAVVALNSARQKSRDSKRVADIKQVQTALELYFADQNGYPADPTGYLGETGAVALCSNGWQATCGSNTTYMGLVPSAPTPADGTCTTSTNPYDYTQTGSGSGYTLLFCIGGTVGDLTAGAHTGSANGIQ